MQLPPGPYLHWFQLASYPLAVQSLLPKLAYHLMAGPLNTSPLLAYLHAANAFILLGFIWVSLFGLLCYAFDFPSYY